MIRSRRHRKRERSRNRLLTALDVNRRAMAFLKAERSGKLPELQRGIDRAIHTLRHHTVVMESILRSTHD